MGIIYIIENDVNNKVYIGQTVYDIEYRFRLHKAAANGTDHNAKLYMAMRAIGITHFRIRELEKCRNDDLNDREIYYIAKFDSFHSGYNSNTGGFGSRTVDLDENTFKMLYYSGEPLSSIASRFGCSVKSINLYRKALGIDPNRGTINNRVRDNSGTERALGQYDLEFNAIRKYDSMRSAINELKLGDQAYYFIRNSCLNGNIAYGYRWQYIDELEYNLNGSQIKFNTIFDKESYILGSPIYKMDNGLYRAKNLRYWEIKTIGNSARPKCKTCGTKLDDRGICIKCSKDLELTAKDQARDGKIELIRALCSEGLNLSEIGRRIGMTSNGVKRYCIKYNINYSSKGKHRNENDIVYRVTNVNTGISSLIKRKEFYNILYSMGITRAKNTDKLYYRINMYRDTDKVIHGFIVESTEYENYVINSEAFKNIKV